MELSIEKACSSSLGFSKITPSSCGRDKRRVQKGSRQNADMAHKKNDVKPGTGATDYDTRYHTPGDIKFALQTITTGCAFLRGVCYLMVMKCSLRGHGRGVMNQGVQACGKRSCHRSHPHPSKGVIKAGRDKTMDCCRTPHTTGCCYETDGCDSRNGCDNGTTAVLTRAELSANFGSNYVPYPLSLNIYIENKTAAAVHLPQCGHCGV